MTKTALIKAWLKAELPANADATADDLDRLADIIAKALK